MKFLSKKFYRKLFLFLKETYWWLYELFLRLLLLVLIIGIPLLTLALIPLLYFKIDLPISTYWIKIIGLGLGILGTAIIIFSIAKKLELIKGPSIIRQIFSLGMKPFPKFNNPVAIVFDPDALHLTDTGFEIRTSSDSKNLEIMYQILKEEISSLEKEQKKKISDLNNTLESIRETQTTNFEKIHKVITPHLAWDFFAVLCLLCGMAIGLILDIFQQLL